MSHGSFVTAINCMDGRTQLPVNEWLRRRHGADYVDTVTEPGPVAILAATSDELAIVALRRRVAISVQKHGSRVVAIVAHHDCAGNPRSESEQRAQLELAAATVESWGFDVSIELLWVGADWRVEQVPLAG